MKQSTDDTDFWIRFLFTRTLFVVLRRYDTQRLAPSSSEHPI